MLHTKNTFHHLLTVMVGTRNTADEAYRVLYFELEDRKRAYDGSMAQKVRNEAKRGRLKRQLAQRDYADEFARMDIEADLMELESGEATMENAILGCEQEMGFIITIMNWLEPRRKYSHLPLGEAFQACQPEEWAYEWVKRTENFMLANNGNLPPDHFEMMRQHPMFESLIGPHIESFRQAVVAGVVGLHKLPSPISSFLDEMKVDFADLLPSSIAESRALLEASKETGHIPLLQGVVEVGRAIAAGEVPEVKQLSAPAAPATPAPRVLPAAPEKKSAWDAFRGHFGK